MRANKHAWPTKRKDKNMFKDWKSEVERYSYCLGLDLGTKIKNLPTEICREALINAINDIFDDKKIDVTNEEFNSIMNKLFSNLDKKKKEEEASTSNSKIEGEKYRQENGKKPGVITTASGLQYEVLVEGNGASPSATDKVKVHYEGTLINGKVFDSSYARKEPIVFPLNQVIKGWTEGVQLMKVGSKFRFVIPSELAYGSRGAGADIPPFSTLIFTVELLAINPR